MKHTFKILNLDPGEWFVKQERSYNSLCEKDYVDLYGPFSSRNKARLAKKTLDDAFSVVDSIILDIF